MTFRVAGPLSANPVFVGGARGIFASTTNQTNPVASTANLVALDTNILTPVGVSNSGGTITFTTAGTYQVTYELFYTSTTGTNPTISQWLYQNSSNIANSCQDFQLLGGANTFQSSICVWQVQAALNDTLRAYWSCSNTNVSLAYQGALTTPTRPASPSATVSIIQIA